MPGPGRLPHEVDGTDQMSSSPTLNSRIRVLVAKAFRAEKLYSSVNNAKGDRLSNLAVLAEAASEIRAKEWQRAHYQLRTSLNDILALGNNGLMAREVAILRERFVERANESGATVEEGAQELIDAARRHEFAHTFKLSLELIRRKAQAQASRVIADELGALLDSSGRLNSLAKDVQSVLEDRTSVHSQQGHPRQDVPLPAELEAPEPEVAVAGRTNVISLTGRLALGSRKR